MNLTRQQLDLICDHRDYAARKDALCRMVNQVSPGIHSLRHPQELALFLAQVLHESARLKHVREVWGPTPAQKRYEGRTDLGNVLPGDGKRFLGRDIIQITGRANYRDLTKWLRDHRQRRAPDFEANPDALEDPRYLGWGALWYWSTRVPSRYVEEGDIEMITRRVNGGLNGYRDRLALYTRAALVLLGYAPDDVRGFQRDNGLAVDGIAGPRTRASLHIRLKGALPAYPPPPPDVEPVDPTPATPLALGRVSGPAGGAFCQRRQDMTYGPIVRIILRYVVGALFFGSAAIGEKLAADPDLVMVGAGLIGALVELFYLRARRAEK